jgi:RNA polymerase sigma-70 factor (ECF subfamily)
MRIPKTWDGDESLRFEAQEPSSSEEGAPSTDEKPHEVDQTSALLLTGREEFEAAMTPLLPRLFRLCVALTRAPDQAEDLLQMSLLKAYQRRRSFAARGSLAGWLAGIIRHEHEETVRKTARRRSLLDRAAQGVYNLFDTISGSPTPDPESWLCSHEEAALLLSCVHELPEPYRTIIWLCDIEELGYEEVAEMVNIPVGTVKSRHARGRQRLRRSLERQKGDS